MLLAPLHECELDRLVAVDRDEIPVLVAVTQTHRFVADRTVGKPSQFRVHPVRERAEHDVAGNHQGHVVVVEADLGLELRGHERILTRFVAQG